MDAIHSDLLNLLTAYTEMRAVLSKLLPARMEGVIGEVRLNEEQAAFVRPKMVDLNFLAEDIRKRAKKDFDQSEGCSKRLQAVLNSELSFTIKLEPKEEYRQQEQSAAPTR